MLHTLSHSPYQIDFNALLRNIQREDAVLLLQDGVIAGLAGTLQCNDLLRLGVKVMALQPDITARGLTEKVAIEIARVDYRKFVALTVEHVTQIAW